MEVVLFNLFFTVILSRKFIFLATYSGKMVKSKTPITNDFIDLFILIQRIKSPFLLKLDSIR